MLATGISKRKVELIIVDSLAPACGDDPSDAAAAVRTMNALRSLGGTRLAIGHVNRVDRERQGAGQTTFGSIFWRNMTRSMWQLQAEEATDSGTAFALYHRKSNNDQRERWPLGYRYLFEPDGGPIHLEAFEMSAEVATGATIEQRIRTILKSSKSTVSDLAERLGSDTKTLDTTLRRMNDVMILPEKLGKANLWALRAKPSETLYCSECGNPADRYSTDGSPVCRTHARKESA
jgi:hypothetical protein